MKPRFRPAMTWLHDWAGLVAGWLLLAITGAGTLSVFRRELDTWTHPELARGPVDQAAAGAAAIGWLSHHAASASNWYLDMGDGRAPGPLAYWLNGSDYVVRMLSPVTGSPDGIRDSLGGEFFYRFHFELQLPYPWGRLLAAGMAELLLVVLISGIVAHRRIFKDFFTFRTGKGQRSWLDGHVVLGVLALPFHLTIAFTGVVTLLTLFLPWGALAAYGGDPTALAHNLYPAVERAHSGQRAPLTAIAPLLQAAQARLDGAGIAFVSVSDPGDRAAIVTVTAASGPAIRTAQHSITFDGVTGRVLGEFREGRPAMQVYDALYGLHMARFAGLATRWLYFLSGAMLYLAIASGLILWTVKRRRPHNVGHALVERLNAGFIAGMPAAFAVFLLANRLLPTAMAARSLWEVRILFGLWGAALLVAAVVPVRRAWIGLLGLAGLLCLGTVAADAALMAERAAAAVNGIDALTMGVDGALLAFALVFAASAVTVDRRRVAP